MREEPLRNDQMQIVLRARHRDVKETTLFFDFCNGARLSIERRSRHRLRSTHSRALIAGRSRLQTERRDHYGKDHGTAYKAIAARPKPRAHAASPSPSSSGSLCAGSAAGVTSIAQSARAAASASSAAITASTVCSRRSPRLAAIAVRDEKADDRVITGDS